MNDLMNMPAPASKGGVIPTEQHRAISEVQASMIIAKRFPRDIQESYVRIMKACERPTLAQGAQYAYPRGGQMITGPSIRLAETIAQNWGNLQFGIRELSQETGESEVEAFAWDIETNTRQIKVFKVPHIRYKKSGVKKLTDPRDIYEMVANQGARRLRACILGVIPGDIIDAAVAQCEKTLQSGDGKPMEDRVRDMIAAFDKIGVTKAMIEDRLQHKTTAIVAQQVVDLGKIYNSIKDGMSKREDWFSVPTAKQTPEADDLTDQLKSNAKPKPEPKKKDPEPEDAAPTPAAELKALMKEDADLFKKCCAELKMAVKVPMTESGQKSLLDLIISKKG